MLKITNSSVETFQLCHRKYFYSYDRCIKPKKESWPLFVGSAYHDALHKFYQGVPEDTILQSINNTFDDLEDQGFETLKNKALVRGMFRGYACIYPANEFDFINPEVSFEVELKDGVIIAGKTDGQIGRNGKPYLLEHKTTSEASITRYLETLNLADQPNFYIYGYNKAGVQAVGVLYRIVVKSKIRLNKNETEEDFCKRLENIYIKDAILPQDERKHYFEETIYRTPENQREWLQELTEKVSDMERHPRYKSTGQCYHWGKACEFSELCQGGEIGENFVKKTSQHEELV